MAAERENPPPPVDEEGRCVGMDPYRRPLPVGGVWCNRPPLVVELVAGKRWR